MWPPPCLASTAPSGAGSSGPWSAFRRSRYRGRRCGRSICERGAAVGERRHTTQSWWVADHHSHPQGDRPPPPGVPARHETAGGRSAAGRQPARAHRARRGRPAPAHRHVLSSGARDGVTGGADVAAARWVDGRSDRARLPQHGDGDGPAHHARQGEDHGCGDSVRGAVGGRRARAPRRRSCRGPPHLQRGLSRQ